MQIHLHEVKILQIHNARPEFVKNITPIRIQRSYIRCNYDIYPLLIAQFSNIKAAAKENSE
jgi:hypothetical protein